MLKIELITITKMSHLLRLTLKKGLGKLGNGLFFVGWTDGGGWVLVLQSTPWDIPLLELPRAAFTSRGGFKSRNALHLVSFFVLFFLHITLRSSIASRQNSWFIRLCWHQLPHGRRCLPRDFFLRSSVQNAKKYTLELWKYPVYFLVVCLHNSYPTMFLSSSDMRFSCWHPRISSLV